MSAIEAIDNTIKTKFKIELKIIKRDELPILKYFRNHGLWKELLHGLILTEETQKILNDSIMQVWQCYTYHP